MHEEPYKYIFIEGKLYDGTDGGIATALAQKNSNYWEENPMVIYYSNNPIKIGKHNTILPDVAMGKECKFLKESDKINKPEYFI